MSRHNQELLNDLLKSPLYSKIAEFRRIADRLVVAEINPATVSLIISDLKASGVKGIVIDLLGSIYLDNSESIDPQEVLNKYENLVQTKGNSLPVLARIWHMIQVASLSDDPKLTEMLGAAKSWLDKWSDKELSEWCEEELGKVFVSLGYKKSNVKSGSPGIGVMSKDSIAKELLWVQKKVVERAALPDTDPKAPGNKSGAAQAASGAPNKPSPAPAAPGGSPADPAFMQKDIKLVLALIDDQFKTADGKLNMEAIFAPDEIVELKKNPPSNLKALLDSPLDSIEPEVKSFFKGKNYGNQIVSELENLCKNYKGVVKFSDVFGLDMPAATTGAPGAPKPPPVPPGAPLNPSPAPGSPPPGAAPGSPAGASPAPSGSPTSELKLITDTITAAMTEGNVEITNLLHKYLTVEDSKKDGVRDFSEKVMRKFQDEFDQESRHSPVNDKILKDFAKCAYLAMYLVKGRANEDAAQNLIKKYYNDMDKFGRQLGINWKNYDMLMDVLKKSYSRWSEGMSGEMAANIFNYFSKEVIDRISNALNSSHGNYIQDKAAHNQLLNAEFLSNPQKVGYLFGSSTGINQGTIMLANSVVIGLGTVKDPERASSLALQRCEASRDLEESLVNTGKWPDGVEPYQEIKTPGQVNTTLSPSSPSIGPDSDNSEEQASDAWLDEGVICMASSILYILQRIYNLSQIKGNQ